jgi:hypothetical protein
MPKAARPINPLMPRSIRKGRGGSSEREWGPTSLPAPTVRGGAPGRSLALRFGAGSGRGLSAPVGSLSGSPSGAEAPFEVPRAAWQSELRQVPCGSPREQAPSVSRDCSAEPKFSRLSLPDLSEKRTPPQARSVRRGEASSVSRPFRETPPPEGFGGSAGPVRESGVGSSFRLRLALLPVRALRLFRLLPPAPKSRRVSAVPAAASDPLPVSGWPLFRRP